MLPKVVRKSKVGDQQKGLTKLIDLWWRKKENMIEDGHEIYCMMMHGKRKIKNWRKP